MIHKVIGGKVMEKQIKNMLIILSPFIASIEKGFPFLALLFLAAGFVDDCDN